MRKIICVIVALCFFTPVVYGEEPTKTGGASTSETACIQEGGPSYNNLELAEGAAAGPSGQNASEAFNLANGFIQRQKDLESFRITRPAVYETGEGIFDVQYQLSTKTEAAMAIVRVNTQKRSCQRIY